MRSKVRAEACELGSIARAKSGAVMDGYALLFHVCLCSAGWALPTSTPGTHGSGEDKALGKTGLWERQDSRQSTTPRLPPHHTTSLPARHLLLIHLPNLQTTASYLYTLPSPATQSPPRRQVATAVTPEDRESPPASTPSQTLEV